MAPLTKKQQKFYAYWLSYFKEHGMAPLYREAMDEMGWSSPNSVLQTKRQLKSKGWLVGDVPIDLAECCPHCGKPIKIIMEEV